MNWQPLSIIDNDKMLGIIGEYLKILEKKSGIKTKFIPSSSWSDVLKKFKTGEIDFIPGVNGSVDADGLMSRYYTAYPMVVASSSHVMAYVNNLEDVRDKTFSVPKGWASWKLIKRELPNAKIIETDTLREAIANVDEGKADLFVGHVAVTSHSIATISSTLRILGELESSFYHHFLLQKEHETFVSIIDKVFDSISSQQKLEIYSKWSFAEVKEGVDYVIVAQVATAVIVIFLIILFYIIKLSRILKNTKIQQKSLNESIDYASTVQMALMSNNHSFDDYFSKSFTIWTPKDQVGGDIYLCRKVSDDEILIYIIDCIGHGIPGALLTVYVKAIEQQVLYHFENLDEPLDTANILEFFHEKMLGLYSDNINQKQALCFDGAVLYYNKKDKIIKFSGANTPIFYIQNGEIKEVKTDRRIIGLTSKRDKTFIEHSIKIDSDTYFYISTDGLMDQLGGEKNLPLGKNKLKTKFLEIYKNDVEDQKQDILNMFESYRGKKEKVDDITLVSFKIEA